MNNSDLKIAVRNIFRNKVQTSISIIGLGIGLGCIILLQALIIHETSFDKFIPDYKNVHRVIFGQSDHTPYPLGEALKAEFPEVKGYFRFCQTSDFKLRNPRGELVRGENLGFSDTSIYRILGIRLISGTAASTVTEIAISEKTALKYFSQASPLGVILPIKINNDFINLSISGVYKDFPANSTLFPDFIANIKLSERLFTQFQTRLGEFGMGITTTLTWDNAGFYTYVVLDKNSDKVVLASKMEKYRDLIKDEKAKTLKYYLQPVRDIYLKSGGLQRDLKSYRTGNSSELKYYWTISFLILLISVTNYIFLTRAATTDRLRELGTKKVLGASQFIIRRQIILESTLVTLLSLIPASFVLNPGMSFVNSTLNRTMTNDVFSNPVMWLSMISVVVFTGTMAGLSIGFTISRIPALLLLSGKTSEKSVSRRWDYSFLIFHFSLYIILVVCVITVSKQIRYSLTNLKGINPKNILISDLNTTALKSSFKALCSEMEKIPGVIKAAGTSDVPPVPYFLPINLANPEGEKVSFDGLMIGEGMTEMLGMEVIEGSPFETYKPWPGIEVLFNESSAKKYNIRAGDLFLKVFHVKGIVKDFHSHSLHSSIQPMVILQQNPLKMRLLVLKTDGTNDKAIINKLRELYAQIDPTEIFETEYLTDVVSDFYSYDRRQGKLIGAFSFLATVLAIMGLFGIALISIARKTKEIGIRKVNGASVGEILYLINKDFVIWVLFALVIGIPVSYYLMSQWQNRFAYKTDLSWWIFAIAGVSAIIVAVLTVSWQSWRAATRNPVEALRFE